MSKTKGGDLMIFVGGESIAYATTHTLSVGADTTDSSNKDEGGGGWASSDVNLLNWSASSDNIMGSGEGQTYQALLALMVAKQPVAVVFATKSGTATNVPTGGWTAGSTYASGNALITSLEANAPNGENATFTVQFTGVGALSLTAQTNP